MESSFLVLVLLKLRGQGTKETVSRVTDIGWKSFVLVCDPLSFCDSLEFL